MSFMLTRKVGLEPPLLCSYVHLVRDFVFFSEMWDSASSIRHSGETVRDVCQDTIMLPGTCRHHPQYR